MESQNFTGSETKIIYQHNLKNPSKVYKSRKSLYVHHSQEQKWRKSLSRFLKNSPKHHLQLRLTIRALFEGFCNAIWVKYSFHVNCALMRKSLKTSSAIKKDNKNIYVHGIILNTNPEYFLLVESKSLMEFHLNSICLAKILLSRFAFHSFSSCARRQKTMK